MADAARLKERVRELVEGMVDELVAVSHDLHARPELAWEERYAHGRLTDLAERHGLPVQRSAHGLETAFDIRVGREGPQVAVLCEYDALPGVGHACGHNIIAAAGIGAALAAAAVADEAGGRLAVLGTPAEEGGGGKVVLARAGAFDDVAAAMMVHPAGDDLLRMDVLAIDQCWVTYRGQAAHAAAFPELGRNALDAAVLGYVNVAALRQHIEARERIHGIFTDAGERPNIVPERAAAHWYVRSPTQDGLEALKARVLTCLEAGATAAGCEMDVTWDERPYAAMLDSEPLLAAYAANSAQLGRPLKDPREGVAVVGSTDMGNVSQLVPSIHPMLAVAPPGVSIHSPEFTRYAASPAGDRAVVDGARAMAMTVVDLWADAQLRSGAADALAAARR